MSDGTSNGGSDRERAHSLANQCMALAEENHRLRQALDRIAAWGEGANVTGSFDEPAAARVARAVLRGTMAA